MLDDPLTHGLWEKTAPPAPPTEGLRGDIAADVAVVGCGYTGLSAALRLAEAGAKVVALEAVEIGFGGAGRNVGLVNAGMWILPSEMIAALGADYGERALDLLGNAPAAVWAMIEKHAIDCEPVPNGTLHCAVGRAGADEISERAWQWGARGAPVRALDAEEAAKRIGTAAYAGALIDLRAGTIQPLGYARGLAQAAIAAGAAVHTLSAVRAAERTAGRWRVSTARGSVTADWIVVATDAYGGAPWPGPRREQIHLPYFNFATTPLKPAHLASILPGREGCWDTKTILSSFRLDRAGRLVFGSVGALRGTGRAIHRAWARRAIAKLFPGVGGVAFEAEWYGMIGMTRDAAPRFHRLADRVVTFCGYNGRGIAPGTVFGRVLADHVLGRISEKDLPLPVTAPEAPTLPRAREAWYEAGAQVAHALGAWG
ncbi:glycine/D-amino acid oxidase-like deaminating enzyme [Roseiarcus fermentans]|uniref:Glycine/D-amino acid oxidase-like deaminating enzyme n=1 Tax=Roseiarcus fermentans TaxID=1473586 RepID=A0A366EQ28_9HYPH|nr:FAD-binding oxidoreductase [Roseiarcus fermentans]RBP04066.1 glycine/D-amino acid oxidase-like deaminating enzyme [Roseiarcus fermentans]